MVKSEIDKKKNHKNMTAFFKITFIMTAFSEKHFLKYSLEAGTTGLDTINIFFSFI